MLVSSLVIVLSAYAVGLARVWRSIGYGRGVRFIDAAAFGFGWLALVGALSAPLHKTARRRAVPWVLGGAGLLAAGAITTGTFALLRDNRASDLRTQIEMGNRPAMDADAYASAVESRDKLVTATWILGAGAVTAGGVGTLLFMFDMPSSDQATIGVAGRF